MATTINATTAGLVETSDGTAVLDLQTGGTTALRVNASQAIGVGSSPSFGTAGQFLTSQGNAASPTWTSGGGGSPGGSNTQFQYNNSGAFAGAANMTYSANGPIVTSLGVGSTAPSASGAGIAFPATQVTSTDANTLDDYEEGTWTPVLIGTTTTGTATYTVQIGKYTKIGRAVSITAEVTYTGGTGTGRMRVTGLPFAGSSAGTAQFILTATDNISTTASFYCSAAYVGDTATNLTPIEQPVGGGTNNSMVYDTAGSFYFSGIYFTT